VAVAAGSARTAALRSNSAAYRRASTTEVRRNAGDPRGCAGNAGDRIVVSRRGVPTYRLSKRRNDRTRGGLDVASTRQDAGVRAGAATT